MGGQKAKYSVKGGFSADFMYKKVQKVLKLCRKKYIFVPEMAQICFLPLTVAIL